VPYEIPVSAYPTQSGVIVVNAPGAGELKDGRMGKYDTLARHLQERGVASFVTQNPPQPDAQLKYPGEPYSFRDASWNAIAVESMAHAVDYALENARAICGNPSPVVYLSGFSAGGSTAGAVAHRYAEVKRLLLVSAYDSVGDPFYDGIGMFTGDLYVAYGALDLVAKMLAHMMQYLAASVGGLHVREAPDFDHGFRGPDAGRVLSNAYLWAFAGEDSFPSPEGGLALYDE
jgi:dienelactone hydrolase